MTDDTVKKALCQTFGGHSLFGLLSCTAKKTNVQHGDICRLYRERHARGCGWRKASVRNVPAAGWKI